MNEIITKQFVATSDWEHGVVSGVASTADIDRMGDILMQDFDLSDYEQNPVLLYNHNRDWVIGSSAEVLVGRKRTTFSARYASIALAQEVRTLAKEGHFTGKPNEVLASVSFRPGKVEEINAEGQASAEFGDVTGLRYSQNKLVEISLVSIPANLKAKVVGREAEFPVVTKMLADNQAEPEPEPPQLDTTRADDDAAAAEKARLSTEATRLSVEKLTGLHRGLCGIVERVRILIDILKEVASGRNH